MAEGFLRELYGNNFDAYSAGTHPSRVNPYAIEVMKEKNIDLSHHTSKSIDQFRDMEFDYVITVCDGARETCPYFPMVKSSCISDLKILLRAQETRKQSGPFSDVSGMR